MAEQNLRIVRSYPRTFNHSLQAAQIGLVGTDKADEGKYTRLSKSEMDLPEYTFDQVRKRAFYLWQRNPLAKRVMEIFTDFCVGDDLVVKIKKMKRTKSKDIEIKEDHEGQKIWDDFYEDPINNLEEDDAGIQLDGFLSGEIALPVFINPVDGFVRLGYIAPQNIISTIPLAKNQRVIDQIEVKTEGGQKTQKLKVIRWNYEVSPTSEDYMKLAGEILFFQMNRLPSQTRGYSIMIDHIDWLDAFDNFMFSCLQGMDARSRYFYDLTLKGLTKEQIDAETYTPPANGAVAAHNEGAEWKIQVPDLKAMDAATAVEMMQDFITGTYGLPKTWFGKGDATNRATAEALTVPTLRMLKRMQGYVKRRHKFTAKFILQEAEKRKKVTLKADEYFDPEVSTFNLGGKDIETAGAGFITLVNALAIAESKGWIGADNCKKLVDGMMNSFGMEIEESESVEDIKQKNKDKKDVDSYDNLPKPPQFDKTTIEGD